MSHDDFAFEPVRGLPGTLPSGEKLLWQGCPRWWPLAIRAYHVRKVGAYFLLLIAWRVAVGVRDAQGVSTLLLGCGLLAVLGAAAMVMLLTLAYFNARSAVYSITSRRILVRQGIAVCLTLNLPLKYIESAALRRFGDGTGDIVMRLARGQRLAFLINWPHLRPGRFSHPEPCFRALARAGEAARILAAALAAEADPTGSRPAVEAQLERAQPRPTAAAAA